MRVASCTKTLRSMEFAMLGEREDAVAQVLGDSTVMLDDRLLGESWQSSVDSSKLD
jgi:hypothetical protein